MSLGKKQPSENDAVSCTVISRSQCELKLTIHNNYNCVSFPAKQAAEKLIEKVKCCIIDKTVTTLCKFNLFHLLHLLQKNLRR